MNPRNTAALALIVAALAAFVYWYEVRGGERRAEVEAASKRVFPDLETADITALDLETSDDKTVRLERADAGWQLVEPVSFPADTATLDGLVSALTQLTSEAVYDEPAPLEDYGLDGDPVLRFRIGEREHALRIGGKSPVGANTYVTTGEGSRVFAVPTYRTSAVRKTFDELRDARILSFDGAAVDGIRAAWPGGRVRLARRDGAWRLVEPLETQADASTISDLLTDLEFLRATGFIDAPPPDAEVGLVTPEFAVELTAGEGELASLQVGASLDGKERAVRGRVASALYRIPAERLDEFPRSVIAYRFKVLGGFDSDAAERFELIFHDATAAQSAVVKGERGDAGWTTAPDAMAPEKAENLIERFAKLEAQNVAAEHMGEPELAGLGLSPPRVTLRAVGAGGAPLAELHLGIADPERGIAARRADTETVYWIDYEMAEHIPLSLEAFRNRFRAEAPAADVGAKTDAAPQD